MYYMGAFVGSVIIFNVFRKGFTFVARTATGWEDPETPEFQQKQIQIFLDNNKDAEVIQLNPNPENYFWAMTQEREATTI